MKAMVITKTTTRTRTRTIQQKQVWEDELQSDCLNTANKNIFKVSKGSSFQRVLTDYT